jgi:hypothetical protein
VGVLEAERGCEGGLDDKAERERAELQRDWWGKRGLGGEMGMVVEGLAV